MGSNNERTNEGLLLFQQNYIKFTSPPNTQKCSDDVFWEILHDDMIPKSREKLQFTSKLHEVYTISHRTYVVNAVYLLFIIIIIINIIIGNYVFGTLNNNK